MTFTTRIKLSIVALLATIGLAAPLALTATVGAQSDEANINEALCAGANLSVGTRENCDIDGTGGGGEAATTIDNLIATVINIFSFVVGVVAVIMIIYGGFTYITSGGDSGKVGNAKNAILYAVIGLIIVAMAQFIVRFVLSTTNSAVN